MPCHCHLPRLPTTELVLGADRLLRDRDGRELLTWALSPPTLTSDLLGQHMRVSAGRQGR